MEKKKRTSTTLAVVGIVLGLAVILSPVIYFGVNWCIYISKENAVKDIYRKEKAAFTQIVDYFEGLPDDYPDIVSASYKDNSMTITYAVTDENGEEKHEYAKLTTEEIPIIGVLNELNRK